jgi:hypothetical protein
MRVKWEVEFHRDFDPEFGALPDDVQNELRTHALLLEQFGPQLGRPRVDTLKGSRHAVSGASPSRSNRNATRSF